MSPNLVGCCRFCKQGSTEEQLRRNRRRRRWAMWESPFATSKRGSLACHFHGLPALVGTQYEMSKRMSGLTVKERNGHLNDAYWGTAKTSDSFLARACRPQISCSWSVRMPLPSRSLETVADRADALRSTLGSLYLEGFVLDIDSLRLWQRWVRGSITLEQLGSLFDDLIYARSFRAPLQLQRSRRPVERSPITSAAMPHSRCFRRSWTAFCSIATVV